MFDGHAFGFGDWGCNWIGLEGGWIGMGSFIGIQQRIDTRNDASKNGKKTTICAIK